MSFTSLGQRAAVVQRELRTNVANFRPQMARTLATFEQGTRKETGRLAGLQIPFAKNYANGQSWLNPIVRDTSFKGAIPEKFDAMFAGLAFRGMTVEGEFFHSKDMERGFIPDSYLDERARRTATHMWKKNLAAIGDGSGGLTFINSSTAGATPTVTCTFDNNGRGRSKGSYRLQVSDSDNPLYYDAVNTTNDTIVGTFWIASKPSGTQFTVGAMTVGSGAALNVANLLICESGSYKKEMMGLAGLISDENRIFQGIPTADNPFIKNPSIDQGDAAITPTAVHAAKQIAHTRENGNSGGEMLICHLTPGNYGILGAYGYNLREAKDNSDTTYGLPTHYEDGDTKFFPDADYEDGYMDFREKKPYFEYVHTEFQKLEIGGVDRRQWIGVNQKGSTEWFEDYVEACNIVWDGRGKDGNGKGSGSPNSAVTIKNIAIPAINQVAYGIPA